MKLTTDDQKIIQSKELFFSEAWRKASHFLPRMMKNFNINNTQLYTVLHPVLKKAVVLRSIQRSSKTSYLGKTYIVYELRLEPELSVPFYQSPSSEGSLTGEGWKLQVSHCCVPDSWEPRPVLHWKLSFLIPTTIFQPLISYPTKN